MSLFSSLRDFSFPGLAGPVQGRWQEDHATEVEGGLAIPTFRPGMLQPQGCHLTSCLSTPRKALACSQPQLLFQLYRKFYKHLPPYTQLSYWDRAQSAHSMLWTKF
jgi:hypothetical protein